jgi:hypothetical protein
MSRAKPPHGIVPRWFRAELLHAARRAYRATDFSTIPRVLDAFFTEVRTSRLGDPELETRLSPRTYDVSPLREALERLWTVRGSLVAALDNPEVLVELYVEHAMCEFAPPSPIVLAKHERDRLVAALRATYGAIDGRPTTTAPHPGELISATIVGVAAELRRPDLRDRFAELAGADPADWTETFELLEWRGDRFSTRGITDEMIERLLELLEVADE